MNNWFNHFVYDTITAVRRYSFGLGGAKSALILAALGLDGLKALAKTANARLAATEKAIAELRGPYDSRRED